MRKTDSVALIVDFFSVIGRGSEIGLFIHLTPQGVRVVVTAAKFKHALHRYVNCWSPSRPPETVSRWTIPGGRKNRVFTTEWKSLCSEHSSRHKPLGTAAFGHAADSRRSMRIS